MTALQKLAAILLPDVPSRLKVKAEIEKALAAEAAQEKIADPDCGYGFGIVPNEAAIKHLRNLYRVPAADEGPERECSAQDLADTFRKLEVRP